MVAGIEFLQAFKFSPLSSLSPLRRSFPCLLFFGEVREAVIWMVIALLQIRERRLEFLLLPYSQNAESNPRGRRNVNARKWEGNLAGLPPLLFGREETCEGMEGLFESAMR